LLELNIIRVKGQYILNHKLAAEALRLQFEHAKYNASTQACVAQKVAGISPGVDTARSRGGWSAA
jgi:hypothetical protein